MEKTSRFALVCGTVVAIALLSGLTSCGMNDNATKQAIVTACVSNGGQWLRAPNVSDFECRKP